MIKEIKLKTKTSNDLKESFPLDINGKTFTSAKDLYTMYEDEFDYLFELQQSGVTNMFGSPAYVESEFNISSKEARQIVSLWMNHYSELKNSYDKINEDVNSNGVDTQSQDYKDGYQDGYSFDGEESDVDTDELEEAGKNFVEGFWDGFEDSKNKSAIKDEDGDIISSKQDANNWLNRKLSEFGNTSYFDSTSESILNKLINKFGSTYFWARESTDIEQTEKINENFDYSSRGALQSSIKTFKDLISFCSEKNIDLSDIVDYCDQRHVVSELQQKTEESNYDYLYRISQFKDIDLLEDFFETDGYGCIKNITQEKLDMYIEEVIDMFEDNGGMYNESVETNKELIKEEIETLRIIGYGWNEDSEQFTDVEDFEYEGDLETVKDKADAVAHRLHKYYDKSYVEITKKDGTVVDKISYDEVSEEPEKDIVKNSTVEEKLEDNKSVVDKVKEPRKPTQKGKAKVTSLSPRK